MFVVINEQDDKFEGPFEFEYEAALFGSTKYGEYYGVIELTPPEPQDITGISQCCGSAHYVNYGGSWRCNICKKQLH